MGPVQGGLGARSVKCKIGRSAERRFFIVGARSADAKWSERGALIQKKVGARSADEKKRSVLGAEENRGAAMSKRVGARSGDVKKGRSAERFLPPVGPLPCSLFKKKEGFVA